MQQNELQIHKAYLIGTHPYSFRCGEPAEIIGVKFVKPSGQYQTRACYHIKFKDGIEDYTPITDEDHYQITSLAIIKKNPA